LFIIEAILLLQLVEIGPSTQTVTAHDLKVTARCSQVAGTVVCKIGHAE
jgi:hypothetical protein